MKRLFLFLVTNVAVLFVLAVLVNVVCAFLGIDLSQEIQGNRNFSVQLLLGAFAFGMVGSLISLLMSKTMAKASVRAQTIKGTEGEAEAWLVRTVEDLAQRAGLYMHGLARTPKTRWSIFVACWTMRWEKERSLWDI